MDDYKHKYLKYKKKYLMLVEEQKKLNNTNNYKIFLGGGSIVIGSKVKTIPNSGSLENMSNQCFWISILDYLQSHCHEKLTLRELRTNAGLNSKTEHMMFDTNYLINKGNENIPIFFNAANRIAGIYDIQIEVYSVNREGIVINQRDEIGASKNIVPIAQFGLQHFELIDNKGKPFIPAVPINGKLTTTTDINLKLKNLYIQLNENLGMMELFNDHLKQLRKKYNNSITNKEHILNSDDITHKEKNNFVFHIDKELNETETSINNLEKKIKDYQNENLSIIHIINESNSGSSSSVTQQPNIFRLPPNKGSTRSNESSSSFVAHKTNPFGSPPKNESSSSFVAHQPNPFGSPTKNESSSSFVAHKTNPFGSPPKNESSSSFVAHKTNPFGSPPKNESSSSFVAHKTNPFGSPQKNESSSSFVPHQPKPFGSLPNSGSSSSYIPQQHNRCSSSKSFIPLRTNPFGSPPKNESSSSFVAHKTNPFGSLPNSGSSSSYIPHQPNIFGLTPNRGSSSSYIPHQPNIFGLTPNSGSSSSYIPQQHNRCSSSKSSIPQRTNPFGPPPNKGSS
jgi:hypothetical protein